MLDINEQ
ncbi:Putative uncharacterized protein [Escherichia coli D6-117.29]|nr:Putative uncharacterized protein [Escherichia coli D6-117.29]